MLEIVIASAIAVIIVLGLAMMEGARARVHEAVRQPLFLEPERKNAALAALRIVKDLETSDRFEVIPDGTNQVLNVRLPDCPTPVAPSCFDNVANYQWVQYRLVAQQLRMFPFVRVGTRPLSCPTGQNLARQVTAMSFTQTSNSWATYSVTWANGSGTRSQIFQGQVISRFRPDQAGAPVTGLDVNNVSPPPGVICN